MVGHGHVTPNPDGSKARCGGPSICRVCALEAGQLPRPVLSADEILNESSGLAGCARCSGDHKRLTWKRFDRPVEVSERERIIQWAMCPTSGDPILTFSRDEEEAR